MLIPTKSHAKAEKTKESKGFDRLSADAREILLNTLMNHCVPSENDGFCKIAISSLLKKLWTKREELENLIIAITTAGSKPTKCVIVPRSLDGRLQVAGKKFFPHVVYARIWRWPDVVKSELHGVKICGFAFDLKLDSVCVNPYHYERPDAASLRNPFPDIPSLRLQSGTEGKSSGTATTDEEPFSGTSGFGSSAPSSGLTGSPLHIDVDDALKQFLSPDISPQPGATYPYADVDVLETDWRCLQPENPPIVSTGDGNTWNYGSSNVTENCKIFPSTENYQQPSIPVHHQFPMSDLQPSDSTFHDQLTTANLPTSGSTFHDQLTTANLPTSDPTFHDQLTTTNLPTSDSTFHDQLTTENAQTADSTSDDLDLQALISKYITNPDPVDNTATPVIVPPQQPMMDDFYGPVPDSPQVIESIIQYDLEVQHQRSQTSSANQNFIGDVAPTAVAQSYAKDITPQSAEPNIPLHTKNVPDNRFVHPAYCVKSTTIINRFNRLLTKLPIPDHWCSVDYYEFNRHVGETFKVRKECSVVTIDGYVNTLETHRFCLGALSNCQRTERSEKVRLHIGKGVKLELHDNGDVWLACHSENSIFLHSNYLDTATGLPPGSYVHKVHPSVCVKVFDLLQCYAKMQTQAEEERNAAVRQAAAMKEHGTSAVNGDVNATAGIGVDDLRRFCMLRLSFVKGWGRDYPRPGIKDTPCWIEVHLHRALQLLDDILQRTPIG